MHSAEDCSQAALELLVHNLGDLDTAIRYSLTSGQRIFQPSPISPSSTPGDEQDTQERDDLIVARVEALVRAGRGQTVLDVVDTELVDAVRAGRTSTAGRLAATLLRAAGTWPWVTFGADPAPVPAPVPALLPCPRSANVVSKGLTSAPAFGPELLPSLVIVPDRCSLTSRPRLDPRFCT